MEWDLGPREEKYYELVTGYMVRQVVDSPVWHRFCESYQKIEQRYHWERDGHHLFVEPGPPDWTIKPFESLLEKSFRLNKRDNDRFPDPPPGGWLCPDTWFTRVNDIVRTRLIVKYLDGPAFLVDALREICAEHSVEPSCEFKCRSDGYYAAHVDLPLTLEVPRRDFDTEVIQCSCEVQITTQLQEVVQLLMHRQYEQRRLLEPEAAMPIPWQWRYSEVQFAANYLGHVLHYLEGMIMHVREQAGGT